MSAKMLFLVILSLSLGFETAWSADNQMLQSRQVQLFYDEGSPGPARDEGPDWLIYDNNQPSGLITGAAYWSKVTFTPVSTFELQAISFTPLNQGPNFDAPCRVRVYAENQNNHDLGALLLEIEIEQLNEWGNDAEHLIEFDEGDYIEFEADENFTIMYEAPGGPYRPGEEGAGWWNLFDGANNFRRSFYDPIDNFGDNPVAAHQNWIGCTGDLLIRANGEYLEGFVDLEVTELYTADEIWMDLPGTEHTFMADVINNGGDIEEFVVTFQVTDIEGNEIWSHEQAMDGLGEGDDMSIECEVAWELPDEVGSYHAWIILDVNDDANAENDVAGLDQIVFDPVNQADSWLSYTDGSFESTTAWNEDSGWATAFHHPGGDCPPLGLSAFRVAIFSEERIQCDFAVHVLNLEEGVITPVWEGTANTDGGGISWIEIEPEFEEDIAITEGEAFTVTYFYANGTRFPSDDNPPFAGTNTVMPFAMLSTQDDGGGYNGSNSGDFPIEVKLVPADWVPAGAHLRVSPQVVDFGMGLQLNQDYEIEAVFSSIGNEPVVVEAIQIPRSAQDYVTVEPAENFEIAAGEEQIVTITFRTNEEVDLNSRLLIINNSEEGNILWTIRASTTEPQDFARRVFLEDFTNAACAPCAQFAPQLHAALDDLGDLVTPIAYHVSWPGADPWNNDNPADARGMVDYYGVRGVPAIYIDGDVFNERSRDAVVDAVEARARTRSPFEINLEGVANEDELLVTVAVTSFADLDNMILRVALTEGHVVFQGANGLRDHYDAMLSILPNANGEDFDIAQGETVDFEFVLDMDGVGWHALDIDNLFLSAWVQGPDQEVHQSARSGVQEGGGEPELVHFNDFTVTDVNHSNLVLAVTFDGEPVPSGWEIGVFTPEGILAGGVIWNADERVGLAAWGDDANTRNVVEGFVAGQRMLYRVWDNETDTEYPGVPDFAQGPEVWGPNGFTVLSLAASGVRELNVRFNQGWNMISINIIPDENMFAEGEDRGPDVILMTDQLRLDEDNHNIRIFKDELGRFYSPAWNFNNIPFWDLTQGYLVAVVEETETIWTGMPIPPDTDVPIGRGWNMIAYFPDYQLSAAAPDFDVLAPIIDHVITAKDYLGRFMSPAWQFSNMPPWQESQGYQVNVDEDVILNYPGPGGELAAALPDNNQSKHWAVPTASETNMSVLITDISGTSVKVGDQIAAFNSTGQIVGVGEVNADGFCGLAVWGDDKATEAVEGLAIGEAFRLSIFDAENATELSLQPSVIHEGLGVIYGINEFSAFSVAVSEPAPENFYLSEAYPNPFNAITRVAFGLPEAAQVSVRVFDISGRLIATLVDGEFAGGHHSAIWDAGDATSGVYMIMLKAGEIRISRKVMLTK